MGSSLIPGAVGQVLSVAIVAHTLAHAIITGLLIGVYAALALLATQAVDLDSVGNDLAGPAQQALEPAHISGWASQRGQVSVDQQAARVNQYDVARKHKLATVAE